MIAPDDVSWWSEKIGKPIKTIAESSDSLEALVSQARAGAAISWRPGRAGVGGSGAFS
ncbi:MAG: hypothetical protein ISN28_01965 [Ectothiorhodospiraceae bacterium AqS1]|nr:hypothetical protein [Ectothiorhodospiraceae bacterium AqS1]